MENSTPHVALLIGFATANTELTALRAVLAQANVKPIVGEYAFSAKNDSSLFPRRTEGGCPSLVILDLSDKTKDRDDLVAKFLDLVPNEIPVIVTASEFAAEEIRALLEVGVTDFILPPFTSASVLPRIWRLLRCGNYGRNVSFQNNVVLQRLGLVGQSAIFQHELGKLHQISRLDITVFVHGETGTGKELVARAIHYLSPRSEHPFVPIDCGAIPADLTESELFGHERGAFTGAVTKSRGLIASASRGTLFLDEIDALSLPVQCKLLRFLQEREYRPLGSREILKADVRVISATNRDLRQMVLDKEFREDLFYRINVLQLHLPGLRHRAEDITLLARYFAGKYAARFKRRPLEFSRAAMQRLLMYQWPGNVRELENVVEAAVALGSGPMIRPSDLMLLADQGPSLASFQEAKAQTIAQFERDYIARLLHAAGGNVSEAARLARKNRRALWELIRKYDIDVAELRESFASVGERKPNIRAKPTPDREAPLKVASRY